MKKFLEGIKEIEKNISAKKNEISAILEANPKGRNFEEIKQKNIKSSTVENIVIKISQLEEEIDKLERKKEAIKKLIYTLNDKLESDILYKKYIEDKTYKVIAKELNFSAIYIQKKIKKAIVSLDKQYKKLKKYLNI